MALTSLLSAVALLLLLHYTNGRKKDWRKNEGYTHFLYNRAFLFAKKN
jgi:hypothetical protein